MMRGMYRNLLGLSRAASICVRVKNSGDVVRITCAAVERAPLSQRQR